MCYLDPVSEQTLAASHDDTRLPFEEAPNRFATTMATNVEHSSTVSTNEVDHVDMLNASYDAYEGVTINIKENMDENVFTTLLQTSILRWRQQGKKGVWLKLSLEVVNLVEPAVKEGFWYHHAEPTYIMLAYWIPETNHTLPQNASHRVGVAAFAMNTKGEVLVLQEKTGAFKGTGVWKLPTGVVEEAEDICAAAIREVKEEAGIDTEFVEVLAFRQSHKSFFSKSDLMFVCMLKPTSYDIKKQDSGIEAAQDWYMDSGATIHVCDSQAKFLEYTPGNGGQEVVVANSARADVAGIGTVLLRLSSGESVVLKDVLHVPTVNKCLISVSKLIEDGFGVNFEGPNVVLYKNDKVIGDGYIERGMYRMNINNDPTGASTSVTVSEARQGSFSFLEKMFSYFKLPRQFYS